MPMKVAYHIWEGLFCLWVVLVAICMPLESFRPVIFIGLVAAVIIGCPLELIRWMDEEAERQHYRWN